MMKNPWLIQRLDLGSADKRVPFPTKIFDETKPVSSNDDSGHQFTREYQDYRGTIINYDYMGSAEFEWGAIPKALRKIYRDQKNFSVQSFEVCGKTVYAAFPSSEANAIPNYLNLLSEKSTRLKEPSYFPEVLMDKTPSHSDVVAWFDLENLVFWSLDKKTFEGLTKLWLNV